MMLLVALSLVGGAPGESPAQRVESGASASFMASATIRRGIGIGRDMAPPPSAHARRNTTVEDSAGKPHPAVIIDFE